MMFELDLTIYSSDTIKRISSRSRRETNSLSGLQWAYTTTIEFIDGSIKHFDSYHDYIHDGRFDPIIPAQPGYIVVIAHPVHDSDDIWPEELPIIAFRMTGVAPMQPITANGIVDDDAEYAIAIPGGGKWLSAGGDFDTKEAFLADYRTNIESMKAQKAKKAAAAPQKEPSE